MRHTLHLPTVHLGQTVLVYAELPSTNEAAHEADHATGTAIVADVQTAGRGQYGRTWQAAAGSSLLLSVVLDPPAEFRQPVLLTAWATVSVAEAILELTGQQAKIKWPNDLLLKGEKCCGVLIEQRQRVVIGLGLNLNQQPADWAAANLPRVVSLSQHTGAPLHRDAVLAVVLKHLDQEWGWLLAGESTRLEADWKWRIGLLGRDVEAVLTDNSTRTGRLREMGFAGIELEVTGGGFDVIAPATIRQLRELGRADNRG